MVGRPYGGTALLIHNRLMNLTVNLVSNDRFAAVLVSDCIVISAYMPCIRTRDRIDAYSAIISELQSVIEDHVQYKLILCVC